MFIYVYTCQNLPRPPYFVPFMDGLSCGLLYREMMLDWFIRLPLLVRTTHSFISMCMHTFVGGQYAVNCLAGVVYGSDDGNCEHHVIQLPHFPGREIVVVR